MDPVIVELGALLSMRLAGALEMGGFFSAFALTAVLIRPLVGRALDHIS